MAYKEPKFDSKSIKAFMGSFNDGVGGSKKKSGAKKSATTKKKK